jgi:hypothetical protein
MVKVASSLTTKQEYAMGKRTFLAAIIAVLFLITFDVNSGFAKKNAGESKGRGN